MRDDWRWWWWNCLGRDLKTAVQVADKWCCSSLLCLEMPVPVWHIFLSFLSQTIWHLCPKCEHCCPHKCHEPIGQFNLPYIWVCPLHEAVFACLKRWTVQLPSTGLSWPCWLRIYTCVEVHTSFNKIFYETGDTPGRLTSSCITSAPFVTVMVHVHI